MKKTREANEHVRTSADAIREKLQDERYGQEYARAYLMAGFLRSAVDGLARARRAAGLTQQDMARLLNTHQPAIARLEKAVSGSVSLRRYAEYLLATGLVPLLMWAPVESVVKYVLADPAAPRSADAYTTRQLGRLGAVPPAGNTARQTYSVDSTASGALTVQDGPRAAKVADQYVRGLNQSSGLNQPTGRPLQPTA